MEQRAQVMLIAPEFLDNFRELEKAGLGKVITGEDGKYYFQWANSLLKR